MQSHQKSLHCIRWGGWIGIYGRGKGNYFLLILVCNGSLQTITSSLIGKSLRRKKVWGAPQWWTGSSFCQYWWMQPFLPHLQPLFIPFPTSFPIPYLPLSPLLPYLVQLMWQSLTAELWQLLATTMVSIWSILLAANLQQQNCYHKPFRSTVSDLKVQDKCYYYNY